MKCYIILLIIAVSCLSTVFNRRIRHRHRRGDLLDKIKQIRPRDNLAYQFVLGWVSALGGEGGWVEECSQTIPGWESAGIMEEDSVAKKTMSAIDSQIKADFPNFRKIIGFLGEAIDLCCNWRTKLVDYFTSRRFRRRLFLQGKRGWFSDIGEFFKKVDHSLTTFVNNVEEVGTSIKNTVVDGVNWAAKKASELKEYIKEKFQAIIKPICDFFNKMKDSFSAWISKHPLVKVALEFGECIKNHHFGKSAYRFALFYLGFRELIPIIWTPIGWAKIVVNLICGWKDIKEAIELMISIKAQKDKKIRYNHIGKIVGHITAAIAGATG